MGRRLSIARKEEIRLILKILSKTAMQVIPIGIEGYSITETSAFVKKITGTKVFKILFFLYDQWEFDTGSISLPFWQTYAAIFVWQTYASNLINRTWADLDCELSWL